MGKRKTMIFINDHGILPAIFRGPGIEFIIGNSNTTALNVCWRLRSNRVSSRTVFFGTEFTIFDR